MSKYKELVYMTLDEIKQISDDSQFNEDHVIFLLSKYRAFLLKQRYSDVRKQIPESNYQSICLDLEVVTTMPNRCGETYLRSKEPIPDIINIGVPRVFAVDYYTGDITYVSRDRMKFVGHNKYLKNIIYCSLGPDHHLYFKSSNPQHLYLERVRFSGVFQDAIKASNLEGQEEGENICNIMDKEFPMEDSLVSPLIEMAVKELLGALYRPKDDVNNAKDDTEDLAAFIARNAKSNLAKQLG